MIKTNNPFGKEAGWIPLFKIGGTKSKENVEINRVIETAIITKQTLKASLIKKGKLFPFLILLLNFQVNRFQVRMG